MTDQPGVIERTIGGPAVIVRVAGVQVDDDAVGQVVIRRGRSADLDQRPEPSTVSLTLLTDKLDVAPRLGDTVQVWASDEAMTYFGFVFDSSPMYRFTGRVTDLRGTPASRRQLEARLDLVAVGPRAELANLKVGDVPWPQELDGPRADRILDAAVARRPTLHAGTVDPGTVTMLARDVDSQPAAALLDELAADSGGELVELRTGFLAWQDAGHRANAVSAVELTADNVLVPSAWSQGLSGMVNRLDLAYGVDPQPSVRVEDTVAADTFGTLDASQPTRLAFDTDAQLRASDIVGRRSRPRWRLDDITVDLFRTVDPVKGLALLTADFATLVTLTGLPASAPFITVGAFVEGSVEVITRDAWQLQLSLTEAAWSGAAPRWVDVPGAGVSWRLWDFTTRTWRTGPDGVTWADVPADVTWLSAVAWDPGDSGSTRWADQPATLRWVNVDPATTWANVA